MIFLFLCVYMCNFYYLCPCKMSNHGEYFYLIVLIVAAQDVEFPRLVRFLCHQCGFVYYHNIAAAVAVIFRRKDEILFTVRNIDPDKGKLDLPGGFIDPDENAEAAVCREVNEELGLQIVPNQLKYLTTQPNHYLYKIFLIVLWIFFMNVLWMSLFL